MAEKNNTVCSICGKPYHMCLSCKDAMKLKPWQVHTCSSEHYKVYQIIHGLSTKIYDKSEAKIKLQNVDLSDLDTFRDNIKTIIKDIMAIEDVEIKPVVEEKSESVEVQEELIEEQEVAKETHVFNKYKANRKNYK
jgi:hypothetical protein